MYNKIKCMECKKEYKQITISHLKKCCGLTCKEYKNKYPSTKLSSEEYIKNMKISVKKSYENGRIPSNKGKKFTETHCKNIGKSLQGRILSEKHKLNIGKSLKGHECSDITKQKIGDGNRGKKLSEQHCKNISKNHKGMQDKNHSEKTIQKISLGNVLRIINNPGGLGLKGKFFSNKNMKEIYYQSSYELKFMELCEQNKNIISYDRCKFYIKYQDKNGQIRRYTPDFKINCKYSKNKIIEIKSNWCIDKYNNPEKFKYAYKYAKENNYIFEIWTEKELNI